MQNLFLLATDKPSRLFIDVDNNKLTITNNPIGGEYMMNQNIYIISNEEIKEGDWCIMTNDYGDNYLVRVISLKCIGGKEIRVQLLLNGKENTPLLEKCEKIILTTDQDLIADGIEQISEDTLLKIVEHINSGKNIESFDEL